MVYIPSSTYRLQLSAKFTLQDVKKQLGYLHNLGISTVYAAPLFKAKTGSEHGYDVAEAHVVGPAIGTLQELEQIAQELKQKGMGWLQDIVPNHMAYHPENTWLMDVLEKGRKSEFATFFDINFQHPEFNGQLMVPFLGEPLEKVIEEGQLELTFGENAFQVKYFDSHYPVSANCYTQLLQQVLEQAGSGDFANELQDAIQKAQTVLTKDQIQQQEWDQIKTSFRQTISQHKELKKAVQQVLDDLNKDTEKLQKFLSGQSYRLCHWQETEKRINYRRFFTVNELICLSMERQDVFTTYHQFIKQLNDKQLFQGLRVDHVDGLFDPDTYLERLREMAGPDTYLVVEKILEGEENLPEDWAIQGNSGYDFLAWVSNLFTDADGEEKLTRLYQKVVPDAAADYDQLVFEKKIYILKNQMPGELDNLVRLLQESDLLTPDFEEEQWREALAILLASFPVYRIYARKFPLSELAEKVLEHAFAMAHEHKPELKGPLQHLRTLFQVQEGETEERQQRKLYFVMRSQQFTGPLAAKGVEDTTFYNYNRLLALNEVGNSPEVFNLSPEQFHQRMQYKLQTYPHSINATATHDTKRGEDARTRLQVLSELPEEWEQHVQHWMQLAQTISGAEKPTANDLYFMFQTLIGVLPIDSKADDSVVERVQAYLEKAFREAKVNSNWTTPNTDYEQAAKDLAKQLLQESDQFQKSFKPFFQKLAHYGWLYSLCQTLLKLTCPGVPDVYQGCELWDFSLVDPDNRRPVDYELRQRYLQEVQQQEAKDAPALHQQLLQSPADARVKFYVVWKGLQTRKSHPELFSQGNYVPVTATGQYSSQVFAFARQHQNTWCLVVVPRLLTQVVEAGELPLEQAWKDTAIALPEGAPAEWRNVFGGEQVKGESLALSAVLKSFPVALLIADQDDRT